MDVYLNFPATLYHGSERLYGINCHIKYHKHLIDEYLKNLPDIKPLNIKAVKDVVKHTSYVLEEYERLMPTDFTPKVPWRDPNILIYVIKELKDNSLLGTIRVSQIISYNLEGCIGDRPWYKNNFEHLLIWVQDIETMKSLEEVENKYILEYDFFSVMRHDIQFFGTREIALNYGNSDKALYVYSVNKNVKLLNISDRGFILKCIEVNMPFYENTPYSEDILNYYIENKSIPYTSKLCIFEDMRETTLIKIAELETELNTKLKALDVYIVPCYDICTKLHNNNVTYKDYLNDLVTHIYLNYRESWVQLALKTNISLNENKVDLINGDIVLMLMSKYYSYEHAASSNFEEINKIFNANIIDDKEQLTKKYESLISKLKDDIVEDIVAAYDRCFNFVNVESMKSFTDTVKECVILKTYSDEYIDSMLNIMAKTDIDSKFKINMVSPRGLWILANWKTFVLNINERASWYAIDTMLLHTLITSQWFKDNGYNGWYSDIPNEYMIVQPSSFGHMRKMNDVYIEEDADMTPM